MVELIYRWLRKRRARRLRKQDVYMSADWRFTPHRCAKEGWTR